MAGTLLNAPPAPLVDENRMITRSWLYALLQMSKSLVSSTVTGPASSTAGALAKFADTTGALLSQLTGTGLVKVTANVASVLGFPADATKFLDGTGAFTVPTGSVVIQGATTTLTDAQIKALPTSAATFLSLIAAPGAGLRIVPVLIDVVANFAAGAYTNINANGYFTGALYNGAVIETMSGVINVAAIPRTGMTAWLGTAWTNHLTILPSQDVEPVGGWGTLTIPWPHMTNAPLGLQVYNGGGGNFTGGNAANTMKLTPYYTVLTY